MWYVRDVLYAVLYVRVSCFVVRGCGGSRRYIYVCYCDIFSVVNVYLDHLKFYVVCINSRRYVCCRECDTLVGVFVFSVMWSELLMTSAISCPLWSSVYECQRVECAFTSPVRTECGMFVVYCMQCCMSVSAVL